MLKTRVTTAIVLVAIFLLALYALPAEGWLFVCAGILATAAWEWAALAGMTRGRQSLYSASMALIAGLIAWNWPPTLTLQHVGPFYFLAAAFWFLAMPIWLKRGMRSEGIWLVAIAGWVVLPPCFFAMIHLRAISPNTLLQFMVIVWLADSAAYFTGRRYGRHKLVPEISPGKTWEGVGGAMLAVTGYGVAWSIFLSDSIPPALGGTLLGGAVMLPVLWILAIFSVCGDLFESALKRRIGVKDSGNILPGHGGILDRIDALIPVLPLSAVLFVI